MKKTTINYIVDIPLLVQSVVVGLSGVLLMYGGHHVSYLGLDGREWLYLHEQIGILMVVFSLLHVVLHWKWLACTTKNFFNFKSGSPAKCETAYPVED